MFINLGAVSMPDRWDQLDGRPIHSTAAHELFHNFGLIDHYMPATGRNPGGWEIMHQSRGLPHPTLAHKIMLGWITDVEAFNPTHSSVGTEVALDLAPVEHPNSWPGKRKGIEFRVADGLNYYFEFRSPLAGAIGDQSIPDKHRVLGTEVTSYGQMQHNPLSEPPIQLLPLDSDGDGPVLDVGHDFRAADIDPTLPAELGLFVDDIIANTHARVRLRYDTINKPDPAIRKKPASKTRKHQSPDIKITNARSNADPNWIDSLFPGNPNTVHATIQNHGGMDAPGVRVKFYVKDYTVKAGPERLIGETTLDVPARGAAEATVVWNAPDRGPKDPHWCIIVRIEPYVYPGTAIVEISGLNNEAQSNYTRTVSATASPWSREGRTLTLTNTEIEDQYVRLVLNQSNPLYRTYLEHDWVRVPSGESVEVALMSEYAGEDYVEGGGAPQFKQFRDEPNDISVTGVIIGISSTGVPVPGYVGGGADFRIVEGVATQVGIDDLWDTGKDFVISGQATVIRTGVKAPPGSIILTFDPGEPSAHTKTIFAPDGTFSTDIPYFGWKLVRAYYVPPHGYGDSQSSEVSNPRVP